MIHLARLLGVPTSFDFIANEAKWRSNWANDESNTVDVSAMEDKYYVLVMFPYPSGDQVHGSGTSMD